MPPPELPEKDKRLVTKSCPNGFTRRQTEAKGTTWNLCVSPNLSISSPTDHLRCHHCVENLFRDASRRIKLLSNGTKNGVRHHRVKCANTACDYYNKLSSCAILITLPTRQSVDDFFANRQPPLRPSAPLNGASAIYNDTTSQSSGRRRARWGAARCSASGARPG